MNQKEKNKIIRLYNKLSFPASFSSPRKFKRSLLENEGIEIGERALRKILEDDLSYKLSKVKPRNPNRRQIVANSVGVSAQVFTFLA